MKREPFVMKRGPGRPRLAPEERVVSVHVCLPPRVVVWVEAKARAAKLRPGQWLAKLIAKRKEADLEWRDS